MVRKLVFGVHNESYNLDFYDDGSLDVFNYGKLDYGKIGTVTSFTKEVTELLVAGVIEFEQRKKNGE